MRRMSTALRFTVDSSDVQCLQQRIRKRRHTHQHQARVHHKEKAHADGVPVEVCKREHRILERCFHLSVRALQLRR